jgi:AcrR family transcriptional regulator
MAKRAYDSTKRQEAAAATRGELIDAAKALLAAKDGVSALTIDAVAARAGTARATVYNHFASKDALLEALYLDLATRGGLEALPAALAIADPMAALMRIVEIFGAFYAGEPLVLRRLRALAALDPDVEKGMAKRDGWRRSFVRSVLDRLRPRHADDTLEIIWSLTSFESFRAAAGPSGALGPAVTARVQRAVKTLLDA